MLKRFNAVFSSMLFFSLCFQNYLSAQDMGTENADSGYSYYKKFKYEASLAYTNFNRNDWWTKIEPFNIYLGALPLKNKQHLDKIVDLGVTHVISMVEDFEIEDGWLNKPVKRLDWEARGIQVKHIQAVDFLPLTHEQIEEGVEHLNALLERNYSVYIHCKAGRGRSATIVIVYLMKYQGFSFNQAFSFIQEQRPQINLNEQQQKAILEYFGIDQDSANADPKSPSYQARFSQGIYSLFNNVNQMSEDKLAELLNQVLHYVIEGISYSPSEMVPASISTWVPSIEVQSTLERRNRYLREYQGDQAIATDASIKRNHGLMRRFKIMAAGAIPFVGTPTSHSISLWHQLREITLIAALNGHDIQDPDVKMKILSCLVGGNILKIPALTVDFIAKEIIKKIVAQAGFHALPVGIPAQLIFNFFTSNSAKVATHAKQAFAGENALPIPQEEYWVHKQPVAK